MIREILLLGEPSLYEVSEPVERSELDSVRPVIADLHDTLMEYRRVHGAGRAIAAPQIGVKKRILYMNIGEAYAFINPVLEFPDDETMTVMDDCMSFPGLLVRVTRYRRCLIRYWDEEWAERSLALEGDLSELIQHEYDHLDGILAVQRAQDSRSLYLGDINKWRHSAAK